MYILWGWFLLLCSLLLTPNPASSARLTSSEHVGGTPGGAFGGHCDAMKFGGSSTVCRCNATYCDTIPKLTLVSTNTFTTITSSKSGSRFSIKVYPISHHLNNSHSAEKDGGLMVVNTEVTYQSIIGFGGALTDAAGVNIFQNLKSDTRQKLLESYYSPSGIEYTLARIPIGSTDFSTHAYTYDDSPTDDLNLTKFSLAPEDLTLKIPLAKAAMSISKRGVRFFSSPWTAPDWMKTNDEPSGRGYIKGSPGGKYYKAWANYLVKFLESYKKEGIQFWGITAQNEPFDGRIPYFPFQSLGFSDVMQRDFIGTDLGPALEKAGYGDVKLMILDDSLLTLPQWAKTIYSNHTASKYVSGLGIHWYMNGLLSRDRITEAHQVDPTKFILATEACAGSGPFEKKVELGSWDRAEQYADDIIQDLQRWVTGWTDWNIALNMSGGPNWVNNNVDSPIIVNPKKNEFYKQPMFYAMGHFSKYLIPGSKRVDTQVTGIDNVEAVTFLTPENNIVAELLNKGDNSQVLQIKESRKSFSVTLQPHAITTVIWKP